MNFRIADTFTDSLARLTAQEQKAAKITAFDLQSDPSGNGLSMHRIDRAKDGNFWSVRVNADIRIIIHRSDADVLLVRVDHHDDAYKWAERRRIERHPSTGAMQLVEVRERIEEVPSWKPQEPATAAPAPRLFDNLRKFELMAFGVPEDWVDDVRAATEDTLFDVIAHLPQEAQEALLQLAVGEQPNAAVPAEPEADPFEHPDAQRRFRLLETSDELRQALDFPWDKWSVFLHPDQRALVERDFNGPARVTGSAGTGKTIVALHRAVHLARANPGGKVLLTTFSKALANALKLKLAILTETSPELNDRIIIKPISSVGYDLYTSQFRQPQLANDALIRTLLMKAAAEVEGHRFPPQFLLGEWNDVVDAWQIRSWEDYRHVARLGRRTRIGGKQREALWSIFEIVQAGLSERGVMTWASVFGKVTEWLRDASATPYDFAVLDEAQDLSVAEAKFLAAMAGHRSNGLFFAGDIGQRIFQQPFSLRKLGLDVRGRSTVLRINYRTSHQIRVEADKLLPGAVSDVDGNTETRDGTISLFEGTAPIILPFPDHETEENTVARWLRERVAECVEPEEIAIFVRSEAQLPRARRAAKRAGLKYVELDDQINSEAGAISLSTMHYAKGLEFRSVAVMSCDDEVLPQTERLAALADAAELEAVYETERHLLYVACTRARDHLIISGIEPLSEFVEDMLS